MPSPTDARTQRLDLLLKLVALVAIPVIVFTEFFKFVPDMATSAVKEKASLLTSYEAFRDTLVGVHASRFAGNELVFRLAKVIERVFRHLPSDPRLHPLRLSAALVASIATALPITGVMWPQKRAWNWGVFTVCYLALAFFSLQIYKPYDLTSNAFVALALLALFADQFLLAAALMIVGGLFRESTMHIVWFAGALAFLRGDRKRLALAAAMGVVWFVEFKLIRNHFGSTADIPMASGSDLRNPSLLLSVAAALLFAAVAAIDLARRDRSHLAGDDLAMFRFFALQIAVVPGWFVFYRLAGGGLAEFRMMLPVLLPIALSLAWMPRGAAATVAR
jgi:hypothetical protein